MAEHKIEVQFVVDHTEDDPRRLVSLTMDTGTLAAIRECVYNGAVYVQAFGQQPAAAAKAMELSDVLSRIERELNLPSLFSLDEFKATNTADKWV